MSEVFGYGVAHKKTGERLPLPRKVYDSKSAASGAITYARKQKSLSWYADTNFDDYEVVPLVAAVTQ